MSADLITILRRKDRPTPVTIIVGIKCKNAIVLASDSQLTYGTAKRTDISKIATIRFKGLEVLVAQSGSVLLSGRYIDILSEMAKVIIPDSPEMLGKIAQDAMMALRNELRAIHFNCTSEELDGILLRKGTECEIMLGFFLQSEPHIYTIDIRQGIYQAAPTFYEAIGCGSALGQYLLAEHATPEMDYKFARVIAIYVVETVKKHDAFCGGPTKVGTIRDRLVIGSFNQNDPVTTVLSPDVIERLAKIVEHADIATRKERTEMIHRQLNVRTRRLFEEIDPK